MTDAVEDEVEAKIEAVEYSEHQHGKNRKGCSGDGGKKEDGRLETWCLHGYGNAVVVWLTLTCLPFYIFFSGAGIGLSLVVAMIACVATPVLVGDLPESCSECRPALSEVGRDVDIDVFFSASGQ